MSITYKDCQDRTRAILACRGQPPYTHDVEISGTEEEMRAHDEAIAAIITDYVTHWKDHLND